MRTTTDEIAAGTGAALISPARKWLTVGLIVLLAAFGLLLRIWSLGHAPINADEAVVGLMAHEILHGHFFAFYWGQSYGGGEPYVVALVIGIFGQSPFTLGITPVLLDAVATVLLWRIGTRLFGTAVGVGAALLFWVWPEFFVWQSTLEYGFRFFALDCGLAALLIAVRLTQDPGTTARRKLINWTGLGLLAGLGWWSTPEIVYYLVPAGGLLLFHLVRRTVRIRMLEIAALLTALFVGALPWIWANLGSGLASLKHGIQPNPPGSPFINHLRVLGAHALPIALGLRLRISGRWLFSPHVAIGLYIVVLIAGVAFLADLIQRRVALVLVGFCCAFPILYALSPFTWFWADGRYSIYLVPMASLAVVAGLVRLTQLLRWPPHIGRERAGVSPLLGIGLALLAGIALTIGAVRQLAPYQPVALPAAGRTGWFSWQSDTVGFLSGLTTGLEAHGVHDVFAGYWLAYPLSYVSRGAITATDPRYARFRPYLDAVTSAKHPAWLFVRPVEARPAAVLAGSSLLDPGCAVKTDRCLRPNELQSWLIAHKIGQTSFESGDFLVIVPDRPVAVTAMLRHFQVEP